MYIANTYIVYSHCIFVTVPLNNLYAASEYYYGVMLDTNWSTVRQLDQRTDGQEKIYTSMSTNTVVVA